MHAEIAVVHFVNHSVGYRFQLRAAVRVPAAYDGSDLELLVDGTGTHFTLWSPKADAAEVLIYDSGRNTPAVDSLVMHRAGQYSNRQTVL